MSSVEMARLLDCAVTTLAQELSQGVAVATETHGPGEMSRGGWAKFTCALRRYPHNPGRAGPQRPAGPRERHDQYQNRRVCDINAGPTR